MALNSPDVRASIDRTIMGDLDDFDRRIFEDKNYYEFLEIFYSRRLRKLWINGI